MSNAICSKHKLIRHSGEGQQACYLLELCQFRIVYQLFYTVENENELTQNKLFIFLSIIQCRKGDNKPKNTRAVKNCYSGVLLQIRFPRQSADLKIMSQFTQRDKRP